MEEKKPREHGLIRIVAFILLFCVLLVSYSYLIRPYFTFKESFDTLKKEEAPIDVLFFGGSSTLVYWAPLLAFERYGISSYALSDIAMAPSMMTGLLEETLPICRPKLYVIDIRAFEHYETDPDTYREGPFRIYTDSMPYSLNRLKTINYSGQYAPFELSLLTHYFDFIYYHGEWRTLGKLNWKDSVDWNESPNELYKGYFMHTLPLSNVTLNAYEEVTEKVSLSEEGFTVLYDLLDYIESKNLPVLFMLNAYAFENEQERGMYNTIFDILDQRGFAYLDTNLYYEEMGLDGKTDFYNENHVNAIGTEKYTDWLAQWLIEHYELEDHSSDARFDSWWSEVPEFNEKFSSAKQHYWDQFYAREDTGAE